MTTSLTVIIVFAAVAGLLKTGIYWLSMRWWKQIIGRYLMYQSAGYSFVLVFASAVRLKWIPTTVAGLGSFYTALAIYTLLASIEVFGVYVFGKMWKLKRIEDQQLATQARNRGNKVIREQSVPGSVPGEDSSLP